MHVAVKPSAPLSPKTGPVCGRSCRAASSPVRPHKHLSPFFPPPLLFLQPKQQDRTRRSASRTFAEQQGDKTTSKKKRRRRSASVFRVFPPFRIEKYSRASRYPPLSPCSARDPAPLSALLGTVSYARAAEYANELLHIHDFSTWLLAVERWLSNFLQHFADALIIDSFHEKHSTFNFIIIIFFTSCFMFCFDLIFVFFFCHRYNFLSCLS